MHRRSALPATGILARGPLAVVSTLVTAGAVAAGLALSQTPTEPKTAAPTPVQHEADPQLPEVVAPDFRAAASSGEATEARALVGIYTTAGRVAEIPTRALAAYQRSATVLGRATADCHLEWTLVAAVARVLTDHGTQRGTHQIGADGLVSPAIVSTPLRYPDGAPIPDTDGGRLDGDPRADRAVGPFLLPPALWRQIGVDGDSDGIRNPQDFDDAALAAAVLLCADDVDLSDARDRTTALERFAPDSGFVTTAKQVAAAYEADDGVSLVQAGPLYARSVLPWDEPVRQPPAPEPEGKEQKARKQDKKQSGKQAAQEPVEQEPVEHEAIEQQEPDADPAPAPGSAPAADEAAPTEPSEPAEPAEPAEEPSQAPDEPGAAPPATDTEPTGNAPEEVGDGDNEGDEAAEPAEEPSTTPAPAPGTDPATPVPPPGVAESPAPPAAEEAITRQEDDPTADPGPDESAPEGR